MLFFFKRKYMNQYKNINLPEVDRQDGGFIPESYSRFIGEIDQEALAERRYQAKKQKEADEFMNYMRNAWSQETGRTIPFEVWFERQGPFKKNMP
jgi:hypothetical protein